MLPGQPLSPVPVLPPLVGVLPPEVVQAWSELEDGYSTNPLTEEQGLVLATEASVASGALVVVTAFSDLVSPEGVKVSLDIG